MIHDADAIAIRRAFESGGQDTAIAELRRRFPMAPAAKVETALAYILAMPLDAPTPIDGHKGPRRDPPGLVRKNRVRP